MSVVFPGGKSILGLIATSFVVVAAPLVVAVVVAALGVQRLADQSRQAVANTETVIRESRAVSEELTAMERSLGQFMILGDPVYYEAYGTHHRAFAEATARLGAAGLNDALRSRLGVIVEAEAGLHERAARRPPGFADLAQLNDAFGAVARESDLLLPESHLDTERAAGELRDSSGRLQNLLVVLAATVIPSAAVLALLFTILINRPLATLGRAIERLGEGDFESAIAVSGPQDLRQLGSRLEWLRSRVVALEGEKLEVLREVSHELKTPLSSIREGIELLDDGGRYSPHTGESREIVAIIRDSAIRLQELVEDLMQFGRTAVARSNGSTPPIRVALAPLIRDAIRKHALQMTAKDIRLRLDVSEVTVRADPATLTTVVDNLISNAVKYAPRMGRVTVFARRHAATSTAVVDVVDDGPGIDPDDRAHVFDAYYQGRTPDAAPVSGSGLGLAIAKRLLEAHGGTIEILDVDGGAHVRARLPL